MKSLKQFCAIFVLRLSLLLAVCPMAASAAVISHTLPSPYRTHLEPGWVNPPETAYDVGFKGDINATAYPIDINGDGKNEFVAYWDRDHITLYSAQSKSQVMTNSFEEIGTNIIVFPLAPMLPVGEILAVPGLIWGAYLPDFIPDLLGLGEAVGRYTLSYTQGGGDFGYWTGRWNRTLPASWDYIGVRFDLEDGMHYGYLHFGYELGLNGAITTASYGVLRGWAWETEPNKGITIIPEPNGISILMVAGCAIALHCRKWGRIR